MCRVYEVDHIISIKSNIDSVLVVFNRNSSPQKTFSCECPLVITYAEALYQ